MEGLKNFLINMNPNINLPQSSAAVIETENIKFEEFKDIAKSICKITLPFTSTFGFLIEIPINSTFPNLKGLITNSNTLNENQINHLDKITLDFENIGKKIELNIDKNNFIFSDPFLDITFIGINPGEIGFNIPFLKTDINAINEEIVVIFNDVSSGSPFLVQGKICQKYGFNLLNTIPCDYGAEGIPLISVKSKNVFGVYKKKKISNAQYNVATSFEIINLAIKIIFEESFSINLNKIGEPKYLNESEIDEIKEHGLELLSSNMFVSPASPFITPIWFYRTTYAWFWTPTEPKDENDETNWMIIFPKRSLKVVGGFWNGLEPALKNIIIINWLNTTRLQFLNI